MILVTGGTGFVGQHLVRQLVLNGYDVRILLRPSAKTPKLPTGVPVEVAVSSLNDKRGVKAALKGIDTVFHLAGTENLGLQSDLEGVDIAGTRSLSLVASEAGIDRIIFLSHLGADQASAFPVLKAKAIAENFILRSGIDYTIFRSAVVFGENDHFTNLFAKIIRISPLALLIPGDGSTSLQPILVDDLITCMVLSLKDPSTLNKIYQVGGGESLPFIQILDQIMDKINVRRRLIPIPPGYLRLISVWLEQNRSFPISAYWIDYLAADRICPLDSLTRNFNLIPARFHQSISYLSK